MAVRHDTVVEVMSAYRRYLESADRFAGSGEVPVLSFAAWVGGGCESSVAVCQLLLDSDGVVAGVQGDGSGAVGDVCAGVFADGKSGDGLLDASDNVDGDAGVDRPQLCDAMSGGGVGTDGKPDVQVLKGPNGGVSFGRGVNYERNQAVRDRRKATKVQKARAGPSHKRVTTQEEQDKLARQWFERKEVENALAIQKGKYQLQRNEWLSRSRVSEKKWEEERLRCEEKLDALSKARLGHGPAGFAETIYSDGSVTPPSLSRGDSTPATLSDGTLSPDSSISVAELRRIEKKFAAMEEEVASLKLCNDSLKTLAFKAIETPSDAKKFDDVCEVNVEGFAGILKDGKRLFLGDPGFVMPITASNCGYTGSDVDLTGEF